MSCPGLSGETSFEARILRRRQAGKDLGSPDSCLLIESRNAEDHMGGEVSAAGRLFKPLEQLLQHLPVRLGEADGRRHLLDQVTLRAVGSRAEESRLGQRGFQARQTAENALSN
ncbi:hypothetical protein ACVITL_006060 [Rhizobium pisi]